MRETGRDIEERSRGVDNDERGIHPTIHSKQIASMLRARILMVLRVVIITDLVRNFADYESYSTLICFFLDEVLYHDGDDAELVDRCLETIIR